jgi:transketolase
MVSLKITDVPVLKGIAREIRKSVITSLAEAGSGHMGGSLGLADIFTCLYFNILNHDPEHPQWEGRDRLILSIGHVAPVLYASLAHSGYFPREELLTLRKLESRLQGHPGRDHGLPGLELSAGSLGQGLSVALGMAIAGKLKNSNNKVFCILGDGELQEGSVWEAAMAAAHHNTDNLIAIVDRNGVQIDGITEKVMALEPLGAKWEAFGWHVITCDGNDIQTFLSAALEAKGITKKPSVILAKTIMGKGVPVAEGDYLWHGRAPSKEQAVEFIRHIDETIQQPGK